MKGFLSFFCLFLICSASYAQDNLMIKLDAIIEKHYPNQKDPGIMLQVHDNNEKILYSGSSGIANLETSEHISSNTNFRMASVSKQFTVFAIWMLVDEYKIDIYNTKLIEFFPNLKGPIANCNIYYLLNHTSGVLDYEGLIPVNQKDQLSDLDVLKIIEPLDSVYFQPGSKWRYSNTGYCLLALIIEKVSGKNYSNYVKEKIFSVFGMRNSLVYNPEDKISNRAYGYHLQDDKFRFADQSLTSATKGDGGVYTSAEEYLLWNAKYFQALGSKFSFSILFKNNLAPINQDISYSYGKFVGKDNLGNTVYFHSGESTGFNNFVLSIPDRNIHISLFSNRDDQKIVSFIDDLLKELDIQIKGLEGKSVFNWLSRAYMNEF